MMQAVADRFSGEFRAHPTDWHMMQKVFVADLTPPATARRGWLMRVGLVCPYSLDIPGGVQNHVKDLAEASSGSGHDVSVLAPAEDGESLRRTSSAPAARSRCPTTGRSPG